MKPILQDPLLEKTLADEGYVVIPFLTEEEIALLKVFYYQRHNKTLDGMYATAHVPDLDLRMSMNNFIREKFSRAISEIFINANPLGGSYIAKGKGEKGTLSPHQDWNIVDEELYRSFNIWVPLVDLHETNGTICVMPRSHLWKKTFRSANIPSAYQNEEANLWLKMSRLHMKAGEALIYDHRLIHASGENTTNEIRLATVYGIIPDEASMKYYHQKDESTIEVYESNPEFFLYGNIFEGPKGLKKISEFLIQAPIISPELVSVEKETQPKGILSRLKAYLNAF